MQSRGIEGIGQFSYEECLEIIKEEYLIPSTGKLKQHHVFYLRAVKFLNEYANDGKILGCHQNSGLKVVPEFADVLHGFIEFACESCLSEKAIVVKSIQLTQFPLLSVKNDDFNFLKSSLL